MKLRRSGIALLIALSIFAQACDKSNLSKLHDRLNAATKSLNAAAKTNRSFYEGGMYGEVGSSNAIHWRQKGATAIHDANEKLIVALNLAKQLTPETFETGKLAVLQTLAQASAGLRTGNQNIDLVLASVATLINQAVVLIEAFQARDLKYVLPEIQTWQIERVYA